MGFCCQHDESLITLLIVGRYVSWNAIGIIIFAREGKEGKKGEVPDLPGGMTRRFTQHLRGAGDFDVLV